MSYNHTLMDRYASLVDAKLRSVMVTSKIFNTKYEGSAKAGAVKVPVRDTEATAAAYDATSGASLTAGATTYLTININKDYAVNELIDGFEAAAVPDNVVADRLDSAAYSLGYQMETDGIAELVGGGTAMSDTTALAANTAYKSIVSARTALSKAKVPDDGRRFLLVTPDITELLLTDTTNFVRASNLGDSVVQSGAIGRIAGFTVYEVPNLGTKVEFVAGHPDWCCRVNEWAVAPHLQDLAGSGQYIGASAVQGRMIYAHKVSKAAAVRVKKHA